MVIIGLMLLTSSSVLAQDKPQQETFQATAMGQSQQLGRMLSVNYNLSALELEITDEKGKNTGILLPVCQFKLDKDKHIAIEAYRNPWKLVNIMDRWCNPDRLRRTKKRAYEKGMDDLPFSLFELRSRLSLSLALCN